MRQGSSAAAADLVKNRVASNLQSFAWNKDGSKIAICPGNNEIWVFKTNGQPQDTNKWERIQVLKEVCILSLSSLYS